MATIKPIEARTIHQIQSGQVIVDLCSVVKELVENSLDAGATTIDVRFKNQGLDSIEVQDNGSGISKENYETLALKHYTSKLSSYSDLGTLQTFGFRGEALSSLCALSKFTVTTCLAADAPKGSKLEFETSGKLCGTNVVAAQKGTTISVEGLFRNLPVRRRELERNIKREWNKVIGVLNQYACIQTGVKFSVSQQPTKGKRIVLFSTKGNQTTRDNIVNVFGSKTLAVLIPLDLRLELDITSAPGKRLTQQEEGSTTRIIHIQGHVSRPAHGEGRQTPDRQMFFVNARPCGLPQFAKVFNEVYKSYNTSQSPFIFADIQLDTHLYDVNVSPDKRTILLHEQSRMLDNLRESLIALFESQDYAVPASQLSMPKYTPFKKPAFDRRDTETPDSGKDIPVLSEDDVRAKSMSAGVEKHPATDSEDDIERSQGPPTTNLSVSTKSIAQDAQNLNFISRWAERKSDVRTDPPTVQVPRSDGGETIQSKEKLVTESTKDSPGGEGDKRQEDEDEGSDLSDSVAETEEAPSQIGNFRARLEEIRNSQTERSIDTDTRSSQPTSEPPIPAISTPSRKPDIRVTKVTPSRNLKRTAPEVATITIGNDTVTSVIGSPSKRLRSEDARSSRSPQKPRAKESVPVPSFQGRLTQMFAAQSQSRSGKFADIEVATEMVDFERQSESSGEHLFVAEDEEEEEQEGQEEEEDKVQEEDSVPESEDCPQNKFDTRDAIEKDVPEDIEEDHPSPEKLSDAEYVDEAAKEDQKELEVSASPEPEEDRPEKISEETQKRTQSFIKGSAKKKDATYPLQQTVRINEGRIRSALANHEGCLRASLSQSGSTGPSANRLDASDAEEKLSLKISKSDFEKMKIVGQFNLGFIIAVRPAERVVGSGTTTTTTATDDELFIIDQHATDEKYNFERLQASTVVQSQRLVQPKTLELTALEEEIIKENLPALEANGFAVAVDDSGDRPVGSRCQLLSLPLSRETTFSLADLEELISLLADHQSSTPSANGNGDGNSDGGDGGGGGKAAAMAVIPRPSKVRKMFAMRACRSSVMIGKPLPARQMERLVRHMGELDKPWNCPHGRPTMRHLCGLSAWDEAGWAEGDGFAAGGHGGRKALTDWAAYVRGDDD